MAVNNKKTFLFILITCIAFALSHDAYAARGGIDVDKILAAGGTITITGADGAAPTRQSRRARKSSKSKSADDDFADDDFADDFDDDDDDFIGGDDFDDDSDDEETPKEETPKEETPAEEPADEKEEAKSEESASEISANGTEEVAASKDEEEKSGSSINDDLFKLDDGDSQTVSVFDFETKALDSDFEAITLIEKSKFGDKIDSCNDVNANSDRPYIKCDIKNSTKKYKFYFKSIGGAAKEPDLTNPSDIKDPKEQKLHEDARKIISAYKETKTKINNKKS